MIKGFVGAFLGGLFLGGLDELLNNPNALDNIAEVAKDLDTKDYISLAQFVVICSISWNRCPGERIGI
jgi:hypothetical protein